MSNTINDALRQWADGNEADNIGFSLQSPNYRRMAALGNVTASSANADVWPGGTLYPFKTTATQMEVVATNAADTAAGTGARTIVLNGLNTDYVEISEVVTMNGLTPVPTVNTFIAINSGAVLTSGSSFGSVGDIQIRDIGGGTVRNIIDAIYGTMRQSIFTVPAGHTLSVISTFGCVNRTAAGGQINYITMATGQKLQNGTIRLPLEFTFSSGNPYRHDARPGIITTEKNSFFLRCTAQSASVDLTGAWLGILKRNVPI